MASSSSSHQHNAEPRSLSVIEPPKDLRLVEESPKVYDVFINHRGPDVKETLARKLYYSLQKSDVHSFLDSEEREIGPSFPDTIRAAIRSASVHVAIFSPGYAESTWCLDELLLMLETTAMIIPVFYGTVEPSHLRYVESGNGAYAAAFAKHREKKRHGEDELEKWKTALNKVSLTAGIESSKYNNGSDLCGSIVLEVKKEVERRAPEYVAEHSVGLDKLVKDFERFYQKRKEKEQAKIIGIVGIGGIGKSTLARELFNRKRSEYHGACFLSNVREKSKKGELPSLQCELLKKLLREDHREFGSREDGISYLMNRFKSVDKSFLIVLDDIDHLDQLEAFPILNNLGNSLAIVTTREKGLLTRARICISYNLEGMSPEYGRELFCRHAFRQSHPPIRYEEVVEAFIKACRGIPLYLKVLGRHIIDRNPNDCGRALNKYKGMLHGGVKDSLKISLETLDGEEEQVFMDMACFFVDKSKSVAIRVWEGSGWNGHRALEKLKEKGLVEEIEYRWNKEPILRMHDLLRDLGREKANELTSPQRLWCPDDLRDLESMGLQKILESSAGTNWRCFQSIVDSSMNAEITYFLANSDGLITKPASLLWLELDFKRRPWECIPPWIPLKKLQFLKIMNGYFKRLWQSDIQAPLQLKELIIADPLSSSFQRLPSSIGLLKQLEKIVLLGSVGKEFVIEGLLEEFCLLESLEHLELRHCTLLSSLPARFGDLRNLRHLNLCSCKALMNLPVSFDRLTRLQYLDFSGCEKLDLPKGLTQLVGLESLKISDCPLSELDFGSGSLWNLRMINLSKTHVTRISISTYCCPRLETLQLIQNEYLEVTEPLPTTVRTIELSECEILRRLPEGFTQLVDLESLKISSCPLSELDFGSGSLWNLRMINLSETHVNRISISADCCRRLETLKLVQFECLEVIGPLPTTIRTIELSECETLRHLPEGFTQLINLQTLKISRCPLSELDFGFGSLWNLRTINISETHVTRISISAGCCRRLETLQLIQFENLEVIGPLPTTVRTIELSECETPRHLPEGFTQLVYLESLKISGCPLTEMDFGSGSLRNLRMINLSKTHVTWISISEDCCPSLETLQLIQNEYLEVIEALPTTVRNIELSECETLRHLPEGFTQLVNLRTLKISGCPLSELDFGSGSLRNLRMVSLSNTHVTWISISKDCCPRLETLQLIQNEYLDVIEPLPRIVRTIELSECESLE